MARTFEEQVQDDIWNMRVRRSGRGAQMDYLLSFNAHLQTSLVPTFSAGSSTPTYTRATTAYVADWEGLLKPVLSGEARFKGARRVRNLLVSRTDGDYSGWVGVSLPSGSTNGNTITFTGAGNDWLYGMGPSSGVISGKTYAISFTIKAGTKTGTIVVRDASGRLGADIAVSLPAVETRYSYTRTATSTGVSTWGYDNRASVGGDGLAGSIIVTSNQIEDVTGQSNQNPSEYVSVGVLSAPYHGANVDGVKYFSYENGNTVASNVVTEAAGAAIAAATLDGELFEAARINAILQSNTLDTTWTISNAADMEAVAANAYVSVDGTTTMDKLQPKATTAVHSLDQAFTFTAAKYTFAADLRYVSATPQRWVALILNDGTTTWGASFDLLNGVAGAVSAGATSTIESTGLANVYRVSVTNTANAAAAAGTVKISLNATDTATLESAARAGTETLGAGMVQHEIGPYATSRITTTTIAVTRAADVDGYPSTSNVAAAAGTVALEFTPQHAPSGTIFLWGTYVDANNYTAILHDATNLIMRKRIGGVNYDATVANTFASGTVYKAAGSWGASGVNIYLNGTAGTPDADTVAAQIGTTMQVGADGNSLQQPVAAERLMKVWTRQLTDAEIASL